MESGKESKETRIQTMEEGDAALRVSRDLLLALQKEDFEAVRNSLFLPFRLILSVNKLEELWKKLQWLTGPVESFSRVQYHKKNYFPATKALVNFQKVTFGLTIQTGPGNSVLGVHMHAPIVIGLTEPWSTPKYVNEASFDERDIKVNPFWLFPGVEAKIAVPKQGGKKPAVLIIHGSGMLDLDSSFGSQKPAKDLAYGLASAGIVVLRIGKPLAWLIYKDFLGGGATTDDEYLYSGKAALEILAKHPEVDPTKIYLLGHSMGGRFVPRICQQSSVPVAGIISAAGLTQLMSEGLSSQATYLQEHFPKDQKSFEEEIANWGDLTEGLNQGIFTRKSASPLDSIPIPLRLSYLVHDAMYPPAEIAKSLDTRFLVLQGMKDWQVTPEENLALWREGLREHMGQGKAVFRTYPNLQHNFGQVQGSQYGMKQYDEPVHVAAEVIADIVDWIAPSPQHMRLG